MYKFQYICSRFNAVQRSTTCIQCCTLFWPERKLVVNYFEKYVSFELEPLRAYVRNNEDTRRFHSRVHNHFQCGFRRGREMALRRWVSPSASRCHFFFICSFCRTSTHLFIKIFFQPLLDYDSHVIPPLYIYIYIRIWSCFACERRKTAEQ